MKLPSSTKVWFASDFHFGHKNICAGVSSWSNITDNCRNFTTIKEMNEAILKGINDNVGEYDILFFLGDWSFAGIQNIYEFRKQIKCKNIYFILGNHDHHIKMNKTLPNIYWLEDEIDIITEENTGILVKAKEVFTEVAKDIMLDYDGYLIHMYHYPIEEWNDRTKKSIHLHGHVHGRIPNGNGRLDVGIDMAYKLLGEYRPFSWEEVLKFTK